MQLISMRETVCKTHLSVSHMATEVFHGPAHLTPVSDWPRPQGTLASVVLSIHRRTVLRFYLHWGFPFPVDLFHLLIYRKSYLLSSPFYLTQY